MSSAIDVQYFSFRKHGGAAPTESERGESSPLEMFLRGRSDAKGALTREPLTFIYLKVLCGLKNLIRI